MWSKPNAAPADHTPKADALTPATIKQKNHGRRYGQVVKLKPEYAAKYKEVHAAVWPEVLKQIKDCNIKDCKLAGTPYSSPKYLIQLKNLMVDRADSIFYEEGSGMLFACFKYVGYDFAGDMERMRENPKVREWWKMTDGFQESLVPGATCSEAEPPAPGWWKPIEEVFYTP